MASSLRCLQPVLKTLDATHRFQLSPVIKKCFHPIEQEKSIQTKKKFLMIP